MFLTVRQTLKVYDFLCEHISREQAIQLLEEHVERNRMVIEWNGTGVLGIAACMQVSDPYDLEGEDPAGKYAYLPFVLVKKEGRGGAVLCRLLQQVLKHCPGARRIAYRRYESPERKRRFGKRHPERVHVLKVKHGERSDQSQRTATH